MNAETPHDERRVYRRLAVDLNVRFMINGENEHSGRTADISAGGLAIITTVRPRLGDSVVLYVDEFSRFEGAVVRLLRGGFGVKFDMTSRKQLALEAKIAARLGAASPAAGRRRYERFKGEARSCVCRFRDGRAIDVRLEDFSVVGANVVAPFRPPFRTRVMIGSQEAVVVRHTSNGFAVEFVEYWAQMAPVVLDRLTTAAERETAASSTRGGRRPSAPTPPDPSTPNTPRRPAAAGYEDY